MVRKVTIPYKPHTGQALLHADLHRFKTVSCGRRWGKTVYVVNHIIKSAILKSGKYWYIAPTYKQAKLIAWEMFKYYLPGQLISKINESELSITLINGSVVRLMGADNPENLRGVGLDGVVLDEFADIKRNVWTTIVRPMLSDTRGWAVFVGTPKGKINHLYEHFIKDKEFWDKDYRTIDGQTIDIDTDYKSFVFKTADSPYIDKVEVDKARQELAPQYFKQEYEASFEDYTGIIYKELNNGHLVEFGKEFIKDWWRVFVGIDTGRHTAVSFITIDDLGKAYVFDEIYNYDGIVKNIAIQIKHKLSEWGRTKAVYIIDSASQVKREYEHNGIMVQDAQKDVENQISQVRSRLSANTLFFNSSKAVMHIVEHKGYVWNEKSKKPEPVKENDHTCNSVQYVLSNYQLTKSTDYQAEKAAKQTLAYLNTRQPKGMAILRNS